MRVGSTNRHADPELIEELRRYAHSEAYDEQPMPELDSEAVDFRAASESFASVRRPLRLGYTSAAHCPSGAGGAHGRRRPAVRPGLVREVGTSPRDPKRRYFPAS